MSLACWTRWQKKNPGQWLASKQQQYCQGYAPARMAQSVVCCCSSTAGSAMLCEKNEDDAYPVGPGGQSRQAQGSNGSEARNVLRSCRLAQTKDMHLEPAESWRLLRVTVMAQLQLALEVEGASAHSAEALPLNIVLHNSAIFFHGSLRFLRAKILTCEQVALLPNHHHNHRARPHGHTTPH